MPLSLVFQMSSPVASASLVLNLVLDMALDSVLVLPTPSLPDVDILLSDFSLSSSKVLTTKYDLEIWIANKFDGVQIFMSGIDKSYNNVGMAVIMNNSLACHVSKVKEIPERIILIRLLFKGKLSVTVLDLYASALAGIRFDQTSEVNSLIAKAINSNTFMVLSGDFNENGSERSASFKFCLNLGLINSFMGHSLVKAAT
ncbi:hypothetical protein G9A89_012481 [Geosiphon pyriformis]|nr:hypothetical protein G9A89_012481 [Geosiphon pyriformis]